MSLDSKIWLDTLPNIKKTNREENYNLDSESTPTIKKRFDSINVESTEENRRAYRDLLITNPDGNKYISGMILYDETIRQSTSGGTLFAEKLTNDGIMPGII